jgi:hypothetical protein
VKLYVAFCKSLKCKYERFKIEWEEINKCHEKKSHY